MPFRVEGQESHTHGLATLTLALENDILEVQFESPASNIVGFEHKATSQKEKAAVTNANKILKISDNLFSFVGSNCQSISVAVETESLMDDSHNGHVKHGEHDHHASADDHSGHSGHSDHDDDSHSEISAHYRFTCPNSAKLTSISLAFFSKFPSVEKINAMWITEAKQGSATLTSTKHSMSLR